MESPADMLMIYNDTVIFLGEIQQVFAAPYIEFHCECEINASTRIGIFSVGDRCSRVHTCVFARDKVGYVANSSFCRYEPADAGRPMWRLIRRSDTGQIPGPWIASAGWPSTMLWCFPRAPSLLLSISFRLLSLSLSLSLPIYLSFSISLSSYLSLSLSIFSPFFFFFSRPLCMYVCIYLFIYLELLA